MQVVLVSGTIAGTALFVVQHLVVVPLIEEAERYEAPAGASDEGIERTVYTAIGTVLLGLACAAVLFGGAALAGASLDVRRGVLLGLAGFACVALAPALSMPPGPPGAAVGDLRQRQLWWTATAALTAVGLWLLARPRATWTGRALGAASMALPHIVGAPVITEPGVVPTELVRRFAVASVATAGLFWILLGATGGYLWRITRQA
jgi:cobalt transporter subunit CbtA